MEKQNEFFNFNSPLIDIDKYSYNKAIDDFERFMELWAEKIEEIRQGKAFFTIQDIKYQAGQLRK